MSEARQCKHGHCQGLIIFCPCCDRWIHVTSNSHYCAPASSGTVAAPRDQAAPALALPGPEGEQSRV